MSQKLTKAREIFHHPSIPPIPSTSLRTGKGGKVPSPAVGEGMGEGCFRIKYYKEGSSDKSKLPSSITHTWSDE